MKKILFVINSLSRAGAENAMLELMHWVAQEDCEISLYVLTGIGELRKELPEGVRLLNKKYCDASILAGNGFKEVKKKVVLSLLKRGNIIRMFPYLCRNLLAMLAKGKVLPDKLLWRTLSDGADFFREKYDLAIAYLEGGSTYYVADHVQADKKKAFVHVDYEKAGYTRRLDKSCYLKFDTIYTVSEEVRDSFLQTYPECDCKTKVFHNLISRENIQKKAVLPGGFMDSYDGIRILSIGRLTEQKAFDVSIEAMKLLKEAHIRARWYVLGEGNQRPFLEKLIEEYGLESDFVLLGAKENPYPYLKQTDLYVHASRYDGKSIAIQEAQVLGCAILVSDCSGNREQVTDGVDGRMCAFTPQAICEGIVSMIADKEGCVAFGLAAAEKMREDKTEQERIKELLN